jgi:fructose-bisphosphate aldolase, class I
MRAIAPVTNDLKMSGSRQLRKIAVLWQGLDANAKVAQDALLYRAKCNRAAREGKYSEEMEAAEPALVATGNLQTHMGNQD